MKSQKKQWLPVTGFWLLVTGRWKLNGLRYKVEGIRWPLIEKIAITQKFKDRFFALLEEGRLQPVIDTVFSIEEAQTAHTHVSQNRNIGKVILEVDTSA